MATRLDRLARSACDLLNALAAISGGKADSRSMDDTWADTTAHGRLILTVLGGLAEFKRNLIRTRKAEGRSLAKARGPHMGHPPKLTPQQQKEARQRRAEGAALKELAKSHDLGWATISRLAT